ncbi:huntingtin-associated protein 1 [Orcinus orca]|uniref:huntingtin-associated protein 1 n=1 Tax=Orcinus orca TaxID=9733 RepID=UPI0021117219|nr:huntingtin-associated protein 1 [Orcinus orca]
MMSQTGQRVEAVLEFGFISQPTRERHNTAPTYSWNSTRLFSSHFSYFCALFRLISSPPERPPVPGTTSCSSAAPSRAWYGPAGAHPGTGYKGPAAAADCGVNLRPQELGQGSAVDWPGPGDPAAVTPAPQPAANPAPEPSAEPEPAPVQVPAAGQAAGSGSATASGPSAGARPASKAGSEAGVQRASAFSAVQGNAQSVPDNSDAPRTRFIFQGPFGPRTAGLGTGKAAGIWKTPAAYIGRRPRVSGPERASFIRELEEALCPDLHPPVKKIAQEDVKVMLSLLEERERDLNTAARIGQSLVKQNSVLPEENSKLEAMLGSAREEILHLRHQVSLRDDLLQLYSDSDDEEEEDEEDEEEERGHGHPYEASDPTPLTESEAHHCPQLEALQERLRLLERRTSSCERRSLNSMTLRRRDRCSSWVVWSSFRRPASRWPSCRRCWRSGGRTLNSSRGRLPSCGPRSRSCSSAARRMGLRLRSCRELASEKEIQMQLQNEASPPPGERVGKASGLGAPASQQSLWAGSQLQDLREKYSERGSMLTEAQEEVKTLRQQAPASTGSVTHYTYAVPLEALPDFQEALAEELRTSIRRIISDPVFFMERNYEVTPEETSDLGYELHYSEDREQEQGLEAEEGLTSAEDFAPAEEFVPEEELGATGEALPADEGVTEEAELVSEEAEAWEEVEPELDEATRMNVVTSALDASGLGPSCLDMKYVLQQLANWQDAHYRQQLRQKMLQKGECSRGGLPPASWTSCRSSSR